MFSMSITRSAMVYMSIDRKEEHGQPETFGSVPNSAERGV